MQEGLSKASLHRSMKALSSMWLQLAAFEAYRDLVRLLQQNLSEEQGLTLAELDNIEARAQAKSAAALAASLNQGQAAGPGAPLPSVAGTSPVGLGMTRIAGAPVEGCH